MEKYLPVLRNCPFFTGLEDHEILSILHCVSATKASKPSGSYIFRAGDSTEVMGLVLTGSTLIIQEDLWGHRNILSKCSVGDFFGEPKDFWVQYRVTPAPVGDKIWSGFDYRADFYRILNEDGELVVPEEYIINGDKYGSIDDLYVEDETFDMFKIWNEYQSTSDVDMRNNTLMDKPVTKDFRIWRRQIPRAEVLGTNRYGLDRIRNPWINLQLKKTQTEESGQDLMQLHDVIVRYFE